MSSPAAPPPPATGTARLASLDVFRGLTVAFMILVNNPGSGKDAYAMLKHAPWHGWTPTDLVFPFFLFIVGVAMTFSYARRVEQGADKRVLFAHALRRGGIIFLIGFLFNLVPKFDWEHVRILGVLQRIGLCSVLASAIYLTNSVRGQAVWTAAILAGYWAAMTLVPVPGFGPGVLQPEGNLEQYIDAKLLAGHLYSGTKIFDPEGILSTFPAVCNVLLGAIAGYLIREKRMRDIPLLGAVLALAGMLIDGWFPINKMIWTSSYVLFTCGLAAMLLWLCWYVVDARGWRTPFRPMEMVGMNALALYVSSGILARILNLSGAHAWLWPNVYAPLASPANASLLFSLSEVAILTLLGWWLYSRKIFLRL